MLRVAEEADTFEITSPMPTGRRLVFAALALFPLLAPYELLLKPGWETIFHPMFGLAAIISLGALCLSALLIWAAIAGMESSARFDRRRRTLTLVSRAPVMPLKPRTCSLSDLKAVEVDRTEWSDSGPSFSLRLETLDGRSFRLLGGYEQAEVEDVRRRLGRFLSEPPAG